MKKLLNIICLLWVLVSACSQHDEGTAARQMGAIRLHVEILTTTNTRVPADYNPKQLAVKIVDEQNQTVQETDDYTEWENTELVLPVGTYTVQVSSNGFDGQESGFDIPYYAGAKTFTVGSETSQSINVTCTLATVKVTVRFTDRFKAAFLQAKVTISQATTGVQPLEFVMSSTYDENRAAYFPVGALTAGVEVTSSKGSFQSTKEFTDVAARDHYVLTYDVNGVGKTQITVSATAGGNLYTYDVDVSQMEHLILNTATVEVTGNYTWNTHTRLLGLVEGIDDYDPAKAFFQYKLASDDDDAYQTLAPQVLEDENYNLVAALDGLTPGTEYTYRVGYHQTEDEVHHSNPLTFTTEEEMQLPNGNMDDWYQRSRTWFPCTSTYYSSNQNSSWWDSSNTGTSTGLAALAGAKNPTTGESTVVHTEGGKSAKLASTSAAGVLAAASLYVGKFNGLVGLSGAKLDWGRPFTSRPKSLYGWYQYKSGVIDYKGNNTPTEANITKNESSDMCSAYIALMHIDQPNANGTAMTVDNTKIAETFPNWETDERVVAYAALPAADCVDTDGEWKELDLQLNYHRNDLKPTHIIIVFAASKYGDYFTGSTKSILYIDDLELIY